MSLTITWTFAPGQIIFASRFNTNFSDIQTWANAHEVLNSSIHGITGTFIDTGTNGQIMTGAKTFQNGVSFTAPGLSTNGRLSLSAGVLKLVGNNGSDPSATNPVYFSVPSATAGKWDVITFNSTTYCTIQDSASADSYFNGGGGTPLGTTAGRQWTQILPLCIYLATDGTNPCLFLSRDPTLKTLPASTGIGYKDTPPSVSSQSNVFAWATSNVSTSHASANCWLIGSIRGLKSSSDDWTFSTLDSGDGLGNFYNFGKRFFIMSTGQNGADLSNYVTSTGGGTAPTYGIAVFNYTIDFNGLVRMVFDLSNVVGGTAGAGANSLALYGPYVSNTSNVGSYGTGRAFNNGALQTNGLWLNVNNSARCNFYYQSTIATATSILQSVQQDQTSRSIEGMVIYHI